MRHGIPTTVLSGFAGLKLATEGCTLRSLRMNPQRASSPGSKIGAGGTQEDRFSWHRHLVITIEDGCCWPEFHRHLTINVLPFAGHWGWSALRRGS